MHEGGVSSSVAPSAAVISRPPSPLLSTVSLVNTAYCCCSLLLVFFLNSGGGGVARDKGILGRRQTRRMYGNTYGTVRAMLPAVSGYPSLFAEAFHPSASHPKHEKGSDNDNETTSNNEDMANPPDASDSTCDANDNESDDIINRGTPHPEDGRLLLFHYESTPSTQDEAKKIAKHLSAEQQLQEQPPPTSTFCVTATSQSGGRGTTGRQWLGAPGNVFVTIGIPVQAWMTTMLRERNIPLTLLPLKIGDLTASLVQAQLDECAGAAAAPDGAARAGDAAVTVKWPNDVLVDGGKISGTLIESASDWFLIGIGINVAHAPAVPTTGADYGRPATSLGAYGCRAGDAGRRDRVAQELGVRLALDLHRWLDGDAATMSADAIVAGWKRWLDWDAALTMRNDDGKGKRRAVTLVDVLPDGRIRVRDKDTGEEEVLVSDYFV